MIIDLLGGSYEYKFKDWNSQRTVNWVPRKSNEAEKDKTTTALIPRPGLTQFVNIAGNCVRGIFTARTLTQERCFAVVGTTLWEINYDRSTTSRGALTGMATGSRSKVYMSLNNNGQLMVMDNQAAYIFDLTTNVLTQITDIDFPGGTTLDYADGYFIISDANGRVSFCELGDGTSWDGLDFFTPTFKPDKVVAVATFREEVYCFGDITIEVYINDGETPFIRQSRTSIYYGLTARHSVASWHGGVFFLGKSVNGGSEVYMMGTNYALNPISTPAISQRLNEQTNEDAEGFVQCTKDGHIFYFLHLPSLNTTLVYDMVSGLWHERQSQLPFADVNGEHRDDMFRGRNMATFKGINLFGDWNSGKIFFEDANVSTDDMLPRKLVRTSPVFHNELKYISVYDLELDINSGFSNLDDDNVMMIKWSIDGGNTFEDEHLVSVGLQGKYDNKVVLNKLGTARNWVISFEVADPVDVMVMQCAVRASIGSY